MKKLLTLLVLLTILPLPALAALPAGAVWEVRTTGSDTNGGAFVAGGSGTDYSQQASAQYALTNGVTNGTTTVATTSASADMVGNVAYIAGGTGSITGGWYYISAESLGVSITVDRSTGLTTGTGVTINVGGALATINQAATNAVSGNKVFVKATATYTTTSGITLSQATANNITPFQLIGYISTRNDGGRPTLQGQTTTGLTLLKTGNSGEVVRNFIIDCNSLATCTGLDVSSGGLVSNITVKNYSSSGINGSFGNAASIVLFGNEVTGGTSTSSVGINFNPASGSFNAAIINNFVHDGSGGGIHSNGQDTIIGNVVANQTGSSSYGIDFYTGGGVVLNNTIYNVGGNGIQFYFYNLIKNNIISNVGGYGISDGFGTNPAQSQYDGNFFFSNTSGNRHSIDDTTASSTNNNGLSPYTNTKDVTLSYSPFVNASTENFALNSTGGAGALVRAAGYPSSWPGLTGTNYVDGGAIQAQPSAGGTGGSFVFGN